MEHLHETCAIVATIDPDGYAANTYVTDVIDMSLYRAVLFIISVGDMAAGATVDFSVFEDTVAAFNVIPTLVAGKAITQMTQAGADNDSQVTLEVRTEEMALTLNKRYLRGSLVTAVDASDVSVVALGFTYRYGNASEGELGSVIEIVT